MVTFQYSIAVSRVIGLIDIQSKYPNLNKTGDWTKQNLKSNFYYSERKILDCREGVSCHPNKKIFI